MHEKTRLYLKNYFSNIEINKFYFSGFQHKTIEINNNIIKIIDLLKFCTSYLPEDCKITERLYHVLNNLYEKPKCPTCNINTCNFYNFTKGYYNTCSKKCSSNNIECKEKYKNTCIEKYGVEHYSQTEEFKNKYKQTCLQNHGVENAFQNKEVQEKAKQTLLINYGVENPSQNEEIQEKIKQSKELLCNNEINKKREKTNLVRYGVINPFQSEDIKNKIKQTNLEQYNVISPIQNEFIKNKIKQTNLKQYGVENIFANQIIKDKIKQKTKTNKFNILLNDKERLNNCTPLFDIEEFKQNKINDNYKFKWKCNVCDTVFHDDISNGTSPICPKCYKKYGSNLQKEIYDFIYSYVHDVHLNDRRFGFEIDILLEKYNLGIEVNGNYWHSDLHGKDKYYHLNKTIEVSKLGISLLHIFEDDWMFRQNIVKNIILDKLDLINNNISNLSIYKITNDMSAEFLNKNCILGDIKDNTNIIHYGLCDLNNIYYLISIQDNKIIRYCSKLNYKINIDDISRLISYICKENNLDSLTVYCDLRYDSGKLFKSIGFNYLKFKHPTYDFIHIKDYSVKINKDNLIFENYDDKLSTWYNAMNNNYDRIWNCGFLIYEFKE